jgi:hypothetical protein
MVNNTITLIMGMFPKCQVFLEKKVRNCDILEEKEKSHLLEDADSNRIEFSKLYNLRKGGERQK